MFFNGWESAKNRPREQELDALRTLAEGEDGLSPFQLVDISKLGLNSKIKKFSDSFICGKGYSPPEKGGRIAFCLQSASLGIAPGLVLLMSIMLIVKVKGVCYNHFVGRRVLPVVASRFCYRRREGYAMTPYEIIMVVLTFLSLLIAVDAKNRK